MFRDPDAATAGHAANREGEAPPFGHHEASPASRAASCPYLRLDASGVLLAPVDRPTDDHRCVAIAGPRIVSRQQQDLMCLRSAHVDCPRYRRATGADASGEPRPSRVPRLPPATTAALIVLAISAAASFGFVIQRGGIDLPSNGPSASAVAAVGSGSSSVPTASASMAPSPSAASGEPSAAASPSSTAPPTASASLTASATPVPTPPPTPRPTPKPSPTPAASGVPSADRLAVIKPCPGQSGCWIYNVRSGDNLWSIAHWFGVPLDTIYAWNPTVRQTGIHAGMPIRIPTPTR